MGKHGKRKIGGYEHVHTYNPKARESNERKMSNMQAIAIRRYQGYVDKIRNNMFNYVPVEQRLKQKPGTVDKNRMNFVTDPYFRISQLQTQRLS